MGRPSPSASSYQENFLEPLNSSMLKALRVLLVENDPDASMMYAFVLEEMGATVSRVASAGAALLALKDRSFDLLISDIRLPDIDGNTFLRQVRDLNVDAKAQIPAIAITGFVDEKTHLQIWTAGFQRLLLKPTDLNQFVVTVAELVGRPLDGSAKN